MKPPRVNCCRYEKKTGYDCILLLYIIINTTTTTFTKVATIEISLFPTTKGEPISTLNFTKAKIICL